MIIDPNMAVWLKKANEDAFRVQKAPPASAATPERRTGDEQVSKHARTRGHPHHRRGERLFLDDFGAPFVDPDEQSSHYSQEQPGTEQDESASETANAGDSGAAAELYRKQSVDSDQMHFSAQA